MPVEVRPFALCVDGLELGEELRNAPNPREGKVVVSLAAPRELLVRAVWPDGQSIERKVPASPAECAAVRRVVLALARAWLATPPPALPPPAVLPPRPPSSPADVDRPVARPRVTPPVPAAPEPPPPPPEPKPPPPTEAVSEPPPPPAPEPEPEPDPLHEQSVGAEQLPPAPEVRWRFAAGALGGGMAGATPAVAGVGAFFVELARNRNLGVGLEGGLESSRVSPPPVAWVSQRWVTLYARGALPLSDRVSLAATLGARAVWVEAGAPGLASHILFSGAAALTVGPEVALGPLILLVRASFVARFPEERILIAGNTVLLLKWWQVGLVAGLAWNYP